MKVTRIACSKNLNARKHGHLAEQAWRLGQERSLVWRKYGVLATDWKARAAGNTAKADRIARNNLGTAKRSRPQPAFEARVRSMAFTAVHAVVDKAKHIVAEDLTRPFVSRKKPGKNSNRRLAAWTKGVTAEALNSVSERRGSALTLVNAGGLHLTSRPLLPDPRHAQRRPTSLERDGDPDITLYIPHIRVRQIIQERADRRRTRLPVQDSSTLLRSAN